MMRRESSQLEALGEAWLAALDRDGRVVVPSLAGVDDDGILARWLYRLEAQRRGGFVPWAALSQRALPAGAPLSSWLEYVHERSGVLYLDGEPAWVEALSRLLEPYELWVIGCSAEAVSLEQDVARLLEEDALHDVATDPSLAAARRGLMAHCAAAGAVQLRGEHGVGKVALCRWVQRCADDAPLSWLTGDEGEFVEGQWALFEEVTELSERGRLHLEAALRAQGAQTARRQRWPVSHGRSQRSAVDVHPGLASVSGSSPALLEVLARLVRVAPSGLPVLLCGEPGVGKEVMARALHQLSGRQGEFVALDMGALVESLAESELFGHLKGAFSGAVSGRQGAFRRAHGGTLFLDEIGNMPMSMQVKLLRALQEGSFTPVGADSPVRVDVRVIAATNADLALLTRQGAFRLDLLSRINAVTLRLPPLRERLEDVEPLAARFAAERGWAGPGAWCEPEVLEALRAHAWPGNVRELGHVVELALTLSGGERVGVDALGALAPTRRRQVPVMTTHSGAAEELIGAVGLERGLVQQLSAATIELLPLRERGERALRHLLLTGLRGRPITAGALAMLQTQPWWGNLPELYASLGALRQLEPGPISVARLKEVMSLSLSVANAAPISVLLSAARVGDALEGLRRAVSAGALLIGRVASAEALIAASRSGDERASRWVEQLERLGASRPACLALEFMPKLSRAHVLVMRCEHGLMVYRLAGTGMRVWASSWLDGQERELEPLEPFMLGPGGALCWGAPMSAKPYLRAFVYLGESSLETFKGQVFEALEGSLGASQTLMRTRTEQRLVEPAPQGGAAVVPESSAHVWALEAHERELLNDLLMTYRGGALRAHLRYGLAMYQEQPRYARLVLFCQEAPRLSQYLTRLYELEANAALRLCLAQRLEHSEQAESLLEAWPVGLRRLMASP